MLTTDPDAVIGQSYDVVIIGSGFGSAFFLGELLEGDPTARVLVLEWGDYNTLDWQLENGRNSTFPPENTYRSSSGKAWNYTIGLGGGTNCWFGQTPRMHPTDFRLKSAYGVGNDWPLDYGSLEPYYVEAERIMSVSGDADMAHIMPRSAPFPQPPHRPSLPDRLMKEARPETHFIMPTARARLATDTRPACCASMRCNLCPIGAKFTAQNGLMPLFENDRVVTLTGAEVRELESAGNTVSAVRFRSGGQDYRIEADLFVLGANAIQSPAILLRSGLGGGKTGLGLHEALGAAFEATLDGIDNFDGSTITTGLDFSLYDGAHRSDVGAAMIYFENRWSHGMRAVPGRMRQTLPLVVVTEDLLDDRNAVTIDGEGTAHVDYVGPSDYARNGMSLAKERLGDVLSPLPVEDILFHGYRETESHLQGTLRMGTDANDSVVDAGMVHHRLRNLVVVGTSTFPTCSCANPSLTAAALSIRSARMLLK
ncbi:GMC oxidoreductase [Wenxinia marina]|uniref:Choline dehydrogenase n=1 Tax=Wenxinia marina DSM 24838 TaxID=1123501 RepID=A0A0D0QAD2_9RHOB|nr:GMC family oxidoreductase [Wenxinia marina]KIQ69277.1 Choline dehydrogenase [Wenxinia marina DSM 24838]GGL71762.1 hypothetical protein GCM10011392_27950 [Wenxinia marina]